MTVLRNGSSGPEVRRLQEALNRKLPGCNLQPDGRYGPRTQDAVRRFQDQAWLVVDGEAGPCTQNALFDTEAYPPVQHQRPFIPQPTSSTCWAAATAMLKRSSVAAVKAATPSDMWDDVNGLYNASDLANWRPLTERYARVHGLRFYPPTSWTPQAFAGMVRQGPVMVDTLWSPSGYLKRVPSGYQGSPGHMTLVVGVRGDNDPSGRGTTLMVYDPWEPNVGRRWRVSYYHWMGEVSTRTYRLFQ
ncbi:peptidoglycan-binding protein [Thermomonas alba]|uniref:peptidoglycan-binding protein n=1 Tax=Thermomonas alba TaxID=2888525 RepID=UPI001F03E0A9|nr:peptidoglycan-binding protein [Thermomonas alba]